MRNIGCIDIIRKELFMANAAEGTSQLEQELLLTKNERTELDRAKTMPIIFDENCPETTPERALRFRRINPIRRTEER